jgi:hypothetical protein
MTRAEDHNRRVTALRHIKKSHAQIDGRPLEVETGKGRNLRSARRDAPMRQATSGHRMVRRQNRSRLTA